MTDWNAVREALTGAMLELRAGASDARTGAMIHALTRQLELAREYSDGYRRCRDCDEPALFDELICTECAERQ
jgi:hypothetical protein